MTLGIEVEVAALLSLVQTVRGVIVTLRTAKRRVRSRMRTTLEGIGAAIWIVLVVASGVSLIAHAGGGLYLLAAVMPFMCGWNVYVAWVLITEISD
jgi:H+/gluconate symporter-like permease